MIWGEGISGRGNSRGRGPGLGTSLVCLSCFWEAVWLGWEMGDQITGLR